VGLYCHVIVSKLEATIENTAVSPTLTVLLIGCCEMTGAVLERMVIETLLDNALEHELLFLVCTE
jgi:hypothetical protein